MIAQSWVSFALNRRSFSLRLLFSLTVLLGLLMAIDIGYERRENHRLQTYKSLEQSIHILIFFTRKRYADRSSAPG